LWDSAPFAVPPFSLPCGERIKVRGEKFFTTLKERVKMDANAPQKRLSQIKTGDHLCLIYDTEEERKTILTSYILQGLERNEKVFYVTDAIDISDILRYLKESVLNAETYLKRNQLSIIPSSEFYLPDGVFNPETIIKTLRLETDKAIAEGYSALRATGETNWVLKKPQGWERLVEYETKLNNFFPGSKTIALCQYDRRKFDAGILLDILTAHPTVIAGTETLNNIYYMPPDELYSKQASSYRFNRWIDTLKTLQQTRTELTDKQVEILRQEEELLESERHFRALADSGTTLILTLNTRMKVNSCNRPWREFTGRTLKQDEGDGWMENIHPDDIVKIRAIIKDAFDHREQFNLVCRMRRRDGIYRWIQSNGSPYYNRKGRFIGYTAYCLDVTEIKETGERLIFLNRLLATIQKINHFIFKTEGIDIKTLLGKVCQVLYETGGYPVVMAGNTKKETDTITFTAKAGLKDESVKDIPVNLDDDRPTANPVLAAVIKREDVIYRNISQDAALRTYLKKTIKSKKRFNSCIGLPILIRENISGVLFIGSDRQNAFDAQERTLLVELSEDISLAWSMILLENERKNLIEQLVRSEKLAAVGELIAGVAHEINNPLTGIMGIAELMLLEDKVKLAKETRKDIENMYEASQRVYKIIANLLRFARREEPMRKNISVSEVMDSVLKMRDYELSTRNIKYEKTYQTDIPNIMADPSQLEQVFLNLINNAEYEMRETGKGGVLTVNIFLEGKKKEEQRVVIEVSDTGPGIKKEAIPKLFDPFFTTKPAGKGTGLGLSVSYGIIKEHGGEIHAANREEGGAVFTIRLPVLEVPDGK
jgi:PAS domain S-box-containing protein